MSDISQTDAIASDLASAIIKDVQSKIAIQVQADVAAELLKIDIPQLVRELAVKSSESFSKSLQSQIAVEVKNKSAKCDISQTIKQTAAEQTVIAVDKLKEQISKQASADIAYKLAQIDIKQQVRDYVTQTLAGLIKECNFPTGSIPESAVNLENFTISGDKIVGGIIKRFESTGIQDDATSCQVTILDEATVIENKLIVQDAEIKGNLVIDGDLILRGEIPTDSPFYKDLVEHSAGLLKLSMDGQFFLQYADKVFDRIKADGIDLSKLTIGGNEILKGNKLGYFITDTNIQKLGELRSLTVNGETNLTNTVFVRNKRVGINTEEPSGVLSIWDEECEVIWRKLRQNESCFGSIRNQRVILSSFDKTNLILEIDGSVTIDKLNIGAAGIVQVSSSATIPKHDAKKGTILFNENPEVGQPVGWVSLGGAKWYGFGIIS